MKRATFALLALMAVALACATVVERILGSDVAMRWIYGSIPFAVAWAVITMMAVVCLVKAKLWRNPPVLLIHLALVGIVTGAGITWATGYHGMLRLSPGESAEQFTDNQGCVHRFPHAIMLKRFEVEYYPGTSTPANYKSILTVNHNDTIAVWMNHVGRWQGYRLYQMGCDTRLSTTILQVTHDPWGIGVTYTAYVLLFVALIWWLVAPNGSYRRLLRHRLLKHGAMILLMGMAPLWGRAASTALPRTVPRAVADSMGRLYILDGDRIAPLQTMARNFTLKLYGKPTYRGMTCEQVLAGWLFYFDDWRNEPMIRIKDITVQRLLGVEKQYVSMADFADEHNTYRLDEPLGQLRNRGNAAEAKGLAEADEKYNLGIGVAIGSALRMFPLNWQGQILWFEPNSRNLPEGLPDDQWTFMRHGFTYLDELVARQDWQEAVHFLGKLRKYQHQQAAKAVQSDIQFEAELSYNWLSDYLRYIAMTLATLGLIAIIVVLRGHTSPRIRHTFSALAAMTGVLLSVVIALRWTASGHVPLSNGFETMQFMSWGVLVTALALNRRMPLLMPVGILTAGLSLMVAVFGESNPALSPLMPVLQSPLLSVHVVLVMLAYSLLAMTFVCGIMGIFACRQPQQCARLQVMSMVLHYPAVVLLAMGIFVGAVWANVSWGTYWSWDPKETWALITLIIYSMPLHKQSLRHLTRPITYHIYMTVAFASVLATYFGVNYLLGGLHSYA